MTSKPIVVDCTYNASIERVWEAIVDEKQMPKWFFPTIERFRPEPGFEAQFTVTTPDGQEFVHLWQVTEVVPSQKIAYRWRYEGIEGDSSVVWELVETTRGTRLTLTHTGHETFPQGKHFSREAGEMGWTYFLRESLKEYLDGDTTPVRS